MISICYHNGYKIDRRGGSVEVKALDYRSRGCRFNPSFSCLLDEILNRGLFPYDMLGR